MPAASHPARNSTASPSANTSSFRFSTIGTLEASRLNSLRNSSMSSGSMQPLKLKTTFPFEALWILSIMPPGARRDSVPQYGGQLQVVENRLFGQRMGCQFLVNSQH